jgi:light-regulated signal transduction histidine kinase (bacteriophytochrome)
MVNSYVELLQRRYSDQLDEDANDFIQFAVDGAARMQQMIEDLLRYSRVATRARPLEPTDLGSVVDDALANLGSAIEEAGATVEVQELPTVMGDRSQMIQLFQNLIANAVKFSADAPPRVEIAAEVHNGEATVAVSDNGIGIPEHQRDRVFAIFQRLNGAEDYPGTGIGLAICKKIVERHNGSIWVESEPDEGSTFYFTLTLSPADVTVS